MAVFVKHEGRLVAGEVPFSAAGRSDFSWVLQRAAVQCVTAGADLESVSGRGRLTGQNRDGESKAAHVPASHAVQSQQGPKVGAF